MDNLTIELLIRDDQAEVVIGKNKQRYADFVKTVESKSPTIKFKVAGESFIDLDKLEKKAAETRKTFQNIGATRLDAGQVNHLTREIVAAHERSRQLQNDIANIKRELADPNRKSSIAFLTDELRAAEKEADGLNRKLSTLSNGNSASGGAGRSTNLRLSSFQKTNLGYQANDIATMAALGASPVQILASQGGQIAQTFSAEQISAFAAAYSGLLPILGAGTAAIALTYKVTGDIRDSAERRLKTEENIAATMNKQLLAAKELRDAFDKQRKDAAEAARVQLYQQTTPIEQIRGRKDLLDKLISLAPSSTNLENYKKELSTLEAQITAYDQKKFLEKRSEPDRVFAENFENRKKYEEDERKRIEKSLEAAEKFKKSVQEGKEKVNEMARSWEQTFDNLTARFFSNNPLVVVFTEGQKALAKLREDVKTLPPELQKVAIAMQMAVNSRRDFESRLDNQLGIFDLRSDAANFRNPYNAEKDKQNQEKYIQRYLYDNPNYLYLKRQEYDGIERTTGYKNTESFEDFYRKEILKQGASVFDTPANRLNKKLDDQYNLLYKAGMTPEQQAIADKKFMSATSGVNPLDLSDKNRELAAQVREREADRREKYDKENLDAQKALIKVNQSLAANQEKLIKIAEKQGLQGIKNFVEIIDKTNGGATVTGATPTNDDTRNYYNLGTSSGSGGLTNY